MDELEKYKKLLEDKINKMFRKDSTGHDLYHLNRVYNLALHLQEKEGGDRLVIGISAFLHDVHRIMEKETGKFCPPKDSLPIISKLLEEVSFPKEKIDNVLHCIEFHEEYNFSKEGKTVSDIETLILQDTDNLDAIGAIGIGRTFTFGGSHNVPMWIPERPFDREYFDESKKDSSTLHHFHSKLIKLKDNMNTETGKKMAQARHEYMLGFIKQFISEWKGEV